MSRSGPRSGARHRLGDLQLAIMRVLWAAGEASVAEVHAALHADRGLAPTTIATMLRKMEEKGVVAHTRSGRSFIYQPTIQEEDVHRSMVGELVHHLFEGDATALVSHLVTEGRIDSADLAALRRRIDAAEHEARRSEEGRTDAGTP